jgi:chromosome segregation ATPase
VLDESIKGHKDQMDSMKGNREEMKGELDKLDAQKQELSDQIGEIFKKKDDLREEFYKQKYLVKKQQEEIKKNDVMIKRKQRLLDDLARKEEWQARKQAEKASRPHPYTREMDLCEHLIGYCRRVGGLTHEEVKVQKDIFFDEMRAKEISDHVNKQLKDGKI